MGRILNIYTTNYFAPAIHKNVKYPMHVQDCYELVYGMEGVNLVTVDGVTYEILPGEVMLIPYGIAHSFPGTVGTKMWVCVFSPAFIATYDQSYGKNNMTLFSKFRLDDVTEEYLKKVVFHEKRPHNFVVKSALYAICAQCVEKASVISEKKNAILALQILDLLEQHYQEPYTMQEAADAFHLEYHYFSSIFHDCFATNFREVINALRFRKACELITGTEMNFSEIAALSGFQSLYMFNSVFKKQSGMTPTEFRKMGASAYVKS